MSKLTGLLLLDLFGSAPQAQITGRGFYDLNDLNYRRLQALALANPVLQPLLEQCLVIERAAEVVCLVPVDLVSEIQSKLEKLNGPERNNPVQNA
jgi:hypothetical protein